MLPPPCDQPDVAAGYLAACSTSDSDPDGSLDDAAGADGPERVAGEFSTDIDEILWWSPADDTSDQ